MPVASMERIPAGHGLHDPLSHPPHHPHPIHAPGHPRPPSTGPHPQPHHQPHHHPSPSLTKQVMGPTSGSLSIPTVSVMMPVSGPNTNPPGHPASTLVRPNLPDRDVTAETIEGAFTTFILCCNPGVPLETDTGSLREAFRVPPKSGGKSFSSFTLFQLIRQLQAKELKTWAELALKLGVEPPDQEKGQSSQKIQQYAVRLKRWMHSMHVDAFFDYLLEIDHPYWTEVPTDPNPVSEFGRDGVAAEDDMALRALLPHIRPKRGRRKPEDDDLNRSPSQRPRLASPAVGDEFGNAWSAHPDGRSHFFHDPSRLGPPAAAVNPSWSSGDVALTPLTAYPQSAITPSTRAGFWENEPRSAITPSKSRALGRRHGAKVVSSAWRSGSGGTGKTRGRPPINRASATAGVEVSFPSLIADATAPPTPVAPALSALQPGGGLPDVPQPAQSSSPGSQLPVKTNLSQAPPHSTPPTSTPTATSTLSPFPPQSYPGTPTGVVPATALPIAKNRPLHHPANRPPVRPPKPSGLSLQVPQRPTGSVRLATPPPPNTAPTVATVASVAAVAPMAQTQPLSHPSHSSSQAAQAHAPSPTPLTAPSAHAVLSVFSPPAHSNPISVSLQHPHPVGTVTGQPVSIANAAPMTDNTTAPPVTWPNPTRAHESFGLPFEAQITKIPTDARNFMSAAQASEAPVGSSPTQPSGVGCGELDPTDRTNMAELHCFFLDEILSANWWDKDGQRISPCSAQEAEVLVEKVVANMRKTSPTKEAFLINLSALAGARILMASTRLKIVRQEQTEEKTSYTCWWELKYGNVTGMFEISETLYASEWKKSDEPLDGDDTPETEAQGGSAESWQRKYRELMQVVRRKDRRLQDVKNKLVQTLKDAREDDEDG